MAIYQSFAQTSETEKGPERLDALRAAMAAADLDAYVVPQSDAFQGEYVADCDARLAWLTGFTGSAGFCVVLGHEAGVFVDGRYRVQVKSEVDLSVYTPVDWPETRPGPWLIERLEKGARVGFDPWLHSLREIDDLEKILRPAAIDLVPGPNLIDQLWQNRPPPPQGAVMDHPIEFAGESSADKRARLAADMKKAGHRAAVLTLPDSICWLLNIRGADIPHVPIVQAYAILHDDGAVLLFADPAKFDGVDPKPDFSLRPFEDFAESLGELTGPVRLDRNSAPKGAALALAAAGIEIALADDPCVLPKACKNQTELDGARSAHLRDAAAMVKFLRWLDDAAPSGRLTEISVVERLENFRRESNALTDISFETIAGAGPDAALPHYRVNEASNRPVVPGELLLVDSGGQYRDGTTDITRTIATGPAEPEEIRAFTLVLKGMIAISRVRFPRGLAGRDLDALARYPLWLDGRDYDHGTGHGVGSFLSVHEGPQRISRLSEAPLRPGMILSNEPGYYREGHFGIRTENLIVVRAADKTGDGRDQLDFETLSFVPIDKRLIEKDLLTEDEVAWLDAYHQTCFEKIAPLVDDDVRNWLRQATMPV